MPLNYYWVKNNHESNRNPQRIVVVLLINNRHSLKIFAHLPFRVDEELVDAVVSS